MIDALIVYHDKLLMFIWATFREKLVSHHRAVNEADSCLHTWCAGSKACTKLVLKACIRHDKCRLSWQAFDVYLGYVSGEARLPSPLITQSVDKNQER